MKLQNQFFCSDLDIYVYIEQFHIMNTDALYEHADSANIIQTYSWEHGAREFYAEHARVREVLQSRADVNGGLLNVGISFKEAFVCSDEERVSLLHRLREAYTTHCTTHKLEVIPAVTKRLRKPLSSHSSVADCAWIDGIDKICRMQVITETLKPETRDLINRCTSQKQLEISMLAAEPTEQVSHPLHLKLVRRKTRVSPRKLSPRPACVGTRKGMNN